MKEQELKYWLAWNRISDIGPKRFHKLIEYFGSAENAWSVKSEEIPRVLNLSNKISSRISEEKNNITPEQELDLLAKYKANVLTIKDDLYPENLKTIHDPPQFYILRGALSKKTKILFPSSVQEKLPIMEKWSQKI